MIVELFRRYDYHPSMIANFDETFLMWGSNKWKVVTRAQNKVGMIKEIPMNEHMTLCATIFADGTHLSALLILPLVNLPEDIKYEDLPQFDWTGQRNGWITKDIFDQYCRVVLIPEFVRRRRNAPPTQQRGLFIVDGHSSRINAGLMKEFKDNNIDVVVIPAHTSHITQPLDLVFFAIFKSQLRPSREYLDATTQKARRMAMFMSARSAFYHACDMKNITDSFKRAGIWPLDPTRLMASDCLLRADTPAPQVPDQATKTKANRINISNQIVTDMIDVLEAHEEAQIAKKNSKKRAAQAENVEAPPKKKKNNTAKEVERMEVDSESDDEDLWLNEPRVCALCERSANKSGKLWTPCDQCDDVWICTMHPLGLVEHYKVAHEDEEPPGRKRCLSRRMMDNDYADFSDDE